MSSAPHLHLTIHEALSGVFGSISLASWIFLLVPQLIENYTQRSAAGISLAFLSVWFIGDITNLLGALWAGLVPTVTALAVYFCFADLVLISQCLYYNMINARRNRKLSHVSSGTEGSAEEPLLSRRRTNSIGLPGSHRRSDASRRRSSLAAIVEEGPGRKAWIKNTVSIFLVCLAGTAGWTIAWQSGVWKPQPELDDQVGGTPSPVGAQILGYASAVCYLGARIPQIVKNQRDKSCEGLSLLFFLLSLLGNLTYGAGILFHSLKRDYILTNLPWLIGSLGTIAEDAIIFIQFRMFREPEGNGSAIE
ncbi:PQ-loop-domain-containing protein [Venturia nashicola]|uniref:PQ-loop-domain-containing protein n=1 Tax=Venturia nashicola TaxID=86259 RepID=A0A4Z1NWB0_9PEZI|nr:PQ-loop-domain-containing protein [Venturia nashicola]TLD22589.1 PQ-loop-domain-containing protein [Venturia nashicola]